MLAAISHAQTSYGSVTKQFADIIATLETKGSNYKPANEGVSLNSLNQKLVTMNHLNTAVDTAFAGFKTSGDKRKNLYDSLSDLVLHIKEAVKSQYGFKSNEYKLVKGLVI